MLNSHPCLEDWSCLGATGLSNILIFLFICWRLLKELSPKNPSPCLIPSLKWVLLLYTMYNPEAPINVKSNLAELLWARRRVRWGRPARPGSGSVRPGGGRIGSFCWDVLPAVGQGLPGTPVLLLVLPPAATTTESVIGGKIWGLINLKKIKNVKLCHCVNHT